MIEIDCLIIGSGPTGLTLGIGLLKAGKTVLIAEKHTAGLGYSKALLVSSDSLRCLNEYGVTTHIQKTGRPLDGFSCFVDEKLVSTCQFDTTQPFHPIILPQEATEQCLKKVYLESGGQIMLGYTFDPEAHDIANRTASEPLVISLESKDNACSVRCRWLFGCDGMHSSVRKALKIDFPGSTITDQQNFVLDLILDFWPYETMFQMWFEAADSGMVMVLSTDPLLVRIVGTTERACSRLQQMFAVRKVVWDSHFICSYRLASSYGRGNVWLAGDACHVHSPLGGRGMNTGISDAIALAQAVGKGDLSGYESERQPPARSWMWRNYLLSQIAMGRGLGFRVVRRVCAVLIRGLAYLLGPNFAVISFQTMTTSVVTRKVTAAPVDANPHHRE
jgi:2-polyprenyl-6-methoxyphenol hydroxylase-like FAD-dependent oxidoreductase